MSSMPCTWNFMSGLSVEPGGPLCFQRPLLVAHSTIFRSLSSVYPGFFAQKSSTQSKKPCSGMPTGTTTSCCLAAGGLATSASAWLASASMRQAKGRGAMGDGPKFTCTVTPLYTMVGKSALPTMPSGKGCGGPARTPFLNRLTVFAFGLEVSRLTSMDTVRSRPNFAVIFFLVLPAWAKPSVSKLRLSGLSRNSEEPAVERPSFMSEGDGWPG
mmetsp:Transcript_27862/g.83072  ORF Transcript_27862/g.83072 Transcript_27862/m.83072 type:complete len:214 (+) Transcript_27862:723-1364(+)